MLNSIGACSALAPVTGSPSSAASPAFGVMNTALERRGEMSTRPETSTGPSSKSTLCSSRSCKAINSMNPRPSAPEGGACSIHVAARFASQGASKGRYVPPHRST